MHRSVLIVLTALMLTVAISLDAGAATKKEKFEKLCLEILESLQAFYPVQSTQKGIHSYDHRLTDYSSKSVKRMIKELESFSQKLHKYRGVDFDVDGQIDYKLIKSDVEMTLLDLKRIKWHKKSPQLYVDEAVNGIYFLMLSQHAPLAEKVYSIISRMKAVPVLFSTARKNMEKPPEVYVDVALESLASAMQFYREVAAKLMSGFPERADEILKVSTRAREAMNEFAAHLEEVESGHETSFAIGKKDLDYKLSHEYFLDIDSDSLLKIGESLLAHAQEEYAQYKEYVENNHQNGQDSVFVPASFCRQDILDYYQWEIGQVKVFLRENAILTVPDDIAPVTVIETPSFLRSMIVAIAYQPAGPFDENQHGYFYVRPIPPVLDSLQLAARYRYVHRRGFKGPAVREAFPGHHLQLQIAGRNENPVRKWQFNTMLIDGWALYCEEMMYHAGLYGAEDPAVWLAILSGIRFRAAGIVADIKLHTGQFTYDECVDWMVEALDAETESEKNYHGRMVRKYTLTPTVWMSYLMGKREITRLRDAAMERDGQSFSEREFYDDLLAQGSIPPALMWEALGLD